MKISLPTRSLASLLGISLLALETVTILPPLASSHALANDHQITPTELVRRLGSDLFQEREEASTALEKLGVEAREALAAGMNSPDPEIVRRCRILLPMIESLEAETLIKKLSGPNADPDALKLPGWDRFKAKVGPDANAKKFFLELCRNELSLIRDVERKPELGFDLILSRSNSFRGFNQPGLQRVNGNAGFNSQISETELGAVLFCALNPKVKVPIIELQRFNTLFHFPAVRSMVQRAEPGTPLRRLVALWLTNPDDIQAMIYNLYILKTLNLNEGIDLALGTRILQDTLAKKVTASSYQKHLAICSLSKFGNKSHVKLLLPFFTDDAAVTANGLGGARNQEKVVTQVNDVALAMAVQLTGQDLKAYGFSKAGPGRSVNFEIVDTLGFASQEQRNEAFAKWAKWVKETKFDPNADFSKPNDTATKPAAPIPASQTAVSPRP